MKDRRSMHLETFVELTDGRRVRTDSVEFRERLPIASELFDRLGFADQSDNEGGEVWEAISALATAILALEARGVQFDE